MVDNPKRPHSDQNLTSEQLRDKYRDDVDALDAKLQGTTWQEYAEMRNAPVSETKPEESGKKPTGGKTI